MAWTASAIFREFVTDSFANAVAYDLSGGGVDTFKFALYNNTITPDKDSALTGYNEAVSQWVTAGEVSDTTGWAAAGRALDNPALTNPTSGVIMFDVDDEVGGACTTGLTSVTGGNLYDDTLAGKPGICYLYFGGSTTLGAGATLTVVYSANGAFRVTV